MPFAINLASESHGMISLDANVERIFERWNARWIEDTICSLLKSMPKPNHRLKLIEPVGSCSGIAVFFWRMKTCFEVWAGDLNVSPSRIGTTLLTTQNINVDAAPIWNNVRPCCAALEGHRVLLERS